jgi:hypothetical protein
MFIDFIKFTTATDMIMGRDSSVGIETCYGLDGPGDRIPVGDEIFPQPSGPALRPTQPPVTMGTGAFRG